MDLRSDTVTQPSAKMKETMMKAPLGDDVFGDDPSVNLLEEYAANLFDKQAALFCPSGTMTNQLAISVYAAPGDEVICHQDSHIYKYEGGGIARHAGASVHLITGNNGRIKPEQVTAGINPDDIHQPVTALVALEDTVNRGGGAIYDFENIQTISEICKAHDLPLHLDGARVFNALVETGISTKIYGKPYDSISICLSKGLGAPVGSLLLGSNDFIRKARRARKAFGGGMRQAGMLAAAGLYALQNNILRLKDDHARANRLASCLEDMPWVSKVMKVETNIVVIELSKPEDRSIILKRLKEGGVRAIPFAKGIRMVTHLDIDDSKLDQACNVIQAI